jgi:hypothetical protein
LILSNILVEGINWIICGYLHLTHLAFLLQKCRQDTSKKEENDSRKKFK